MIVDESRSDDHSLSVYDSLGSSVHPSDLYDFAVAYSYIAMKRGHAGTIDDATVFDQQVIRHEIFLLLSVPVSL
jgi:hypothetical protein